MRCVLTTTVYIGIPVWLICVLASARRQAAPQDTPNPVVQEMKEQTKALERIATALEKANNKR